MSLRAFLEKAHQHGYLVIIDREVDPHLEMARIINALGGRPVLFTNVRGSDYRVVAGVCSARKYFALALDIEEAQLLPTLIEALTNPVEPEVVASAPRQEVVEREVDLDKLPNLTHLPGDGGPYIT
ncbi:MAG TPA: hypothetical protein ENF84_00740, partial [Chloroflexi bacterium]|nr:hypothetical protein [Chloroflexota bacterium]